MELERVIDVLAKEKPNKLLIYIRDNLLFNDSVRNFFSYSRYNRYLEKLNVYCYEHINNESNTILIRLIE